MCVVSCGGERRLVWVAESSTDGQGSEFTTEEQTAGAVTLLQPVRAHLFLRNLQASLPPQNSNVYYLSVSLHPCAVCTPRSLSPELFLQKKIIMSFQSNGSGYVEVYTDGACRNNGRPDACAGIGVWWYYNHPLNISRRVTGYRHSSQVAEIQAAAEAVTLANESNIGKLQVNIIKTDLKFLCVCSHLKFNVFRSTRTPSI